MAGMSRRKRETVRKLVMAALLVVAAACVVILAVLFIRKKSGEDAYGRLRDAAVTEAGAVTEESDTFLETESDTETVLYDWIPEVDFETLWNTNTDICAWISVPGAGVDYPVLRNASATNPHDAYYLQHTVERASGLPGAIYIEPCNAADFTDPVTVIYGHHMKNGTMFGSLHEFQNDAFFEENTDACIVTPERTYVYRIFAEVVYDDRHITGTYDFSSEEDYQEFLDSLEENRDMRDIIREDVAVTPEERIIVLSTCVKGEDDRRLLIGAVLTYEYEN